MLSQFSYPIICTDKFAATVSFYEDNFCFTPALEMENFVIMKRKDWPDTFLAVMSSDNKALPESHRKSVQGTILNMPVSDVDATYKKLFFEGLNIVTEPDNAICGRRHFFVEDPNGMLVDVAQNMDFDKIEGGEKIKEICVVG